MPRNRPRHPFHARVAERAEHCCEYCLAPEEFSNKEFQVEHVVPRASGGADVLGNLALACFRRNLSKATAQTARRRGGSGDPPVQPRSDDWNACFDVVLVPGDEVVLIEGKTATGRATAERLKMNAPHAKRARWKWFLAYALEAAYVPD